MRCLTLADALAAQGAQCHFICREHAGNLIAFIRQRGYVVDVLPAPTKFSQVAIAGSSKNDSKGCINYAGWLGVSWHKDAEETSVFLEVRQTDWLVIDHYALDHRWETALRPHCKNLMVIDDLADRVHHCDLLLDQNLGRTQQDYTNLVPTQCKVLTGPQYALLRPEFAALRAYSLQRRQQPSLKQLLIAMGGVDQPNATGQVLQALQGCTLPPDCRIEVVMGQQSPWIDEVQTWAQSMAWPTEVLVNISDMSQHMANSDLAIGAAGGSSWERCCLGLPTVMVVLAENQRPSAKALVAAQAGVLICDVAAIATQLPLILKQLNHADRLVHMSTSASIVTNGRGVEKVMQALGGLNG